MGRRSDHSRDELKQLAITEGHALLAREGLHGLSARKLASTIGYTVGTLYNIFEDLDDITLHLNAHTLDMLHEYLHEQCDCTQTGQHAIQSLANAYVAFATTHPKLWSALFEFSLPDGKTLPDWYQPHIQQLFTLVEQALVSDYASEQEARFHANVLWASIHGICQLGMSGKLDAVEAGSITQLTDALIKNYMANRA